MSSTGFIYFYSNLDWTIPWKDGYNPSSRMNNATFTYDSSNNLIPNSGTYTLYTKPTDTSGTVQPAYYSGILDTILTYTYNGNYLLTGSNNTKPILQYITSQYGNPYMDSSKNYVYPNLDTFRISNFYAVDNSGGTILIQNFNVNRRYTTNYQSNFNYNLNKNSGCILPIDSSGVYIESYLDTTQVGSNFIYKLYYGSSTEIPEYLKTKFNIKRPSSYNYFLSKNIPGVISWELYSEFYGTPQNTGWFIAQVDIFPK